MITEKKRNGCSIWMSFLISLVVSIVVVASVMVVYEEKYATKIYTFDLAAYSQNLAEQVATQKMSMEQANEALDKVDRLIREHSEKKGSVILISDAVMGGNVETLKP